LEIDGPLQIEEMNDKSNGTSKKSTERKIPFLSRKKTTNPPSSLKDAGTSPSLGGALSNMKISAKLEEDKEKKEKDKDKTKEKDKEKEKEKAKQLKLSTKEEKEKNIPFEKAILKANNCTYIADHMIGNGSFGVVFRATVQETSEVVAIKKVLQDKRYKNRELQIMRLINHPNIVALRNSFYTNGDKPEEVFLNLVLEFVPETVYRVVRHYAKLRQTVPIFYTKLYAYQILRSLAYLHGKGICHRDIKPQNLLLDPVLGILKLCDFGSAKVLVEGEPNVAYICSRYYRAPELIFGSTNYATAIDVWSVGCVVAELMLGQPLFPGESGVDQMVEIVKILGTPTRDEIMQMNQTYTEYKFPQITSQPWSRVFRSRTPPDAIDLISKLLKYIPSARLSPIEGLIHPFFDELRDPTTQLPNGKPLPPLFNFSDEELKYFGALAPKLIPPHIDVATGKPRK